MQAVGSSNGLDVFLCSIPAETPVKLLQLRLCPHDDPARIGTQIKGNRRYVHASSAEFINGI